jgi:two-component system chemotaxis response regulator CheY
MSDKKNILVIEDEESLRSALVGILEKEGFGVEQAENGKEGLEKALKSHPDLMLVDLLMPVMSGVDMVKKLQKDTWGQDAELMFLTNVDDPTTVAEVTSELTGNVTIYDYLIKSDWDLDKIVKEIKTKLGIK